LHCSCGTGPDLSGLSRTGAHRSADFHASHTGDDAVGVCLQCIAALLQPKICGDHQHADLHWSWAADSFSGAAPGGRDPMFCASGRPGRDYRFRQSHGAGGNCAAQTAGQGVGLAQLHDDAGHGGFHAAGRRVRKDRTVSGWLQNRAGAAAYSDSGPSLLSQCR